MPESPPQIQLAQAAPPGSAAPIGRVDTLTGTATAQHVDGSVVTLQQGAPVYARDLITTKEGAKVALVLVDKTTFALGESGQLRLDELVYNPGKEGKLALSMLKGAFAFVSGDIAPSASDAMTVRTPVGTIGIRGTAVSGNVDPVGGGSSFTLVADPSGVQSVVAFTNASGYRFLDTNNQTIVVHSFFEPPSAPTLSNGPDTTSDVGQLVSLATTVSISANPPGSAPAGGEHGGATPDHSGSPQGTDGTGLGGAATISVTLPSTPSPPAPPPPSVPDGWDHGAGANTVPTSPPAPPSAASHPVSDDALPVTVPPIVTSPSSTPLIAPASPPAPPAGLTFHGTLGADNFVGGPTNDLFEFVSVVNSLQSGDRIDGGGGHDTLTAALSGNVTLDGSLSIHNVEQIRLTLVGDATGASSLNAGDILAAPAGTTITLAGSGNLALDHLAVGLDASQFTGALKIDAAIGGIAIDGGSGNDTITSAGGETVGGSSGTPGISVVGALSAVAASQKPPVVASPAASTIAGGAGNNLLIGGPKDVLDYSHATGDVIVDFHTDSLNLSHTRANGYGGSDAFSGFDGVIGASAAGISTTVTLAAFATTHVSNVQVVHGDSVYGGDMLVLDTPNSSGITIDNIATLVATGETNVTVSGGGGILGAGLSDSFGSGQPVDYHLTITGALASGSVIQLDGANDSVIFTAPVPDSTTLIGVEHIGSNGDDAFTVGQAGSNEISTMDGGGGADTLHVGGDTDMLTIANTRQVDVVNANITNINLTVTALPKAFFFSYNLGGTAGSTELTLDLPGSTSLPNLTGSSGPTQIVGIDTLVLEGGSYQLTFDGTVVSKPMKIDGSHLTAGQSLFLDLSAESGAISVTGGSGADTLIGGRGAETLTGGGGADMFRINNATDQAVTITDFNLSNNQLELGNQPGSAAPFGDLSKNGGLGPNGPLSAAVFLTDAGMFTGGYDASITPGLNPAFDAGKPVLIEDATHTLYYDPTGQFGTGYSAIAHFQNGAVLTAANIHLHA